MNRVITSAALYFAPHVEATVALTWFEAICHFLANLHLPVQHFDVSAEGFSDEDTYELDGHKNELIRALSAGSVQSLGLYSGLVLDEGKYDWRAHASVRMWEGMSFLGIEETIISEPQMLLRHAYTIVRDLLDIGYGISYWYPMSKGPECYASGGHYSTLAEFEQEFEAAIREGTSWSDEMLGEKRYLRGRFRGAYPASILSDAHVNAPIRTKSVFSRTTTLRSLGLGALTQIDQEAWLWELSGEEIEEAQAMLRQSGLLIGS